MDTRLRITAAFTAAAIFITCAFTGCAGTKKDVTITRLEACPEGSWQTTASFPDRKGYVDDTLAMNSIISFYGYEDQGKMYLTVLPEVSGFEMFINNVRVDTSPMKNGTFEIDFSAVAVNGMNTLQVTNIEPGDITDAVTVSVPYPVVTEGTLEEVGIDREPVELIEKIIAADIANGFSAAQLVIIKDGKLVYRNAWGLLDSYYPDGTRITDGQPVTNDTMFDLASNTKMYSVVYAVQYLADRGTISLDEKVADIIGPQFVEDTIEIRFSSYGQSYPATDVIKEWKGSITVKDLLMHQAGFPDSGHYHNDRYDAVNQRLSYDVDNVLYVGDGSREKTLWEGICRTPLMYEPGTKTMYSDIDYMLLGLIIEKKTGTDLNTFLSETFWKPMGLERITYCPLENGFGRDDCAATELNGNTRDGLISFPGIRTETIWGEVHDEESYYNMEGISGHAGLFSSATDLAFLAFAMLTGGYGENRFFSIDTRDLFISPQAGGSPNYGIGWWRNADDRRSWYFGSASGSDTVGHQGWTGTLTMIDFENDMVVVYLTNSVNTPVWEPLELEDANSFSGRWYTASTLGFVPQILYTGLGNSGISPEEALDSLLEDMIREKKKLVEEAAAEYGGELPEDHPIKKALAALESIR